MILQELDIPALRYPPRLTYQKPLTETRRRKIQRRRAGYRRRKFARLVAREIRKALTELVA